MSQRLDKLPRMSTILFGGKFKKAIGDGVAENTSHVICISTGVGLGRLKPWVETGGKRKGESSFGREEESIMRALASCATLT